MFPDLMKSVLHPRVRVWTHTLFPVSRKPIATLPRHYALARGDPKSITTGPFVHYIVRSCSAAYGRRGCQSLRFLTKRCVLAQLSRPFRHDHMRIIIV